jgi:ATP-dependent RNA helicase DDX52/ROK1
MLAAKLVCMRIINIFACLRSLIFLPDIIIGTPLRLVTALQAGNLELHKYARFIQQNHAFMICVRSVRHLVIDEADRLLDSEFVSQLQEIISACTHENLQKAVFSATLPTGAEKLAMRMLQDPIRVVVGLK